MINVREINHFHLFCGLGGGAKGFNKGQARVGTMQGKFVCIGGVDVDPASIADFNRLAGVPGTVLDMFSLEQYVAFHGKLPPSDWREATPADLHRAAHGKRPHIVFLSAPCKGFSGLLSEGKSKTDKYQALNGLTLRGVWLMLEAWKNDPPELIVFENVPRIASRGRQLLDEIIALLRAYGYVVAETTHDCGVIGGLAQSRKRFLMVARHAKKVPAFLYEPERRPLRAVGDILGKMPMPGDAAAGPMHRVPSLQWKTWVRLAFVEAGSDWRSLNKLRVVDGKLADYLIMPQSRNGRFGVVGWEQSTGTVAGETHPTNGNFSIADVRMAQSEKWTGQAYGVRKWDQATGTVTSKNIPGQGPYSVADVRMSSKKEGDNFSGNGEYGITPWGGKSGTIKGAASHDNGKYSVADPRHTGPEKHSNEFAIVPYNANARAVTSAHGTGQCVADPGPKSQKPFSKFHVADWDGSTGTVIGGDDHGAYGVSDPRPGFGGSTHHNVLKVTPWGEHAGTISSSTHPSGGALTVADVRILNREKGDAYLTGGHYGVLPWEGTSGAVSSSAGHDNGRWSVADHRMPEASDKMVCVIRALDGTWHRPFTTLELGALQSLLEPEEHFELQGLSDAAWRERIGNAVPPDAAAAIAGVMGVTLLLTWSGETFTLSSQPIWVQPVAMALSIHQGELA